MYKDVLEKLNYDRRVDDGFIKRLERNGFEICYGKYDYWDAQPYIEVGKRVIWLVESYIIRGAVGCRYRYRNEVCGEIKDTISRQIEILEKDVKLINEVLPIE